MIVAVDAMGGDNAPDAVIEGCVEAVNELNVDIIMTGREDYIKSKLSNFKYPADKIKIVNATEVISNNEPPVMAIRRKKDSSLSKAMQLVKNGEAHALVSAGSTGAFLAGSIFVIGRIKGIDRPALAPVMPGRSAPFMVIDCGANVDCKPNNLLQFAIMGKVYFENILGVKNPSIGLVNIGSEEEKGNELTKATYTLLKESGLNFAGNVEPRDVSNGDINILVCDGFVGNTILKMYEGVASNIFSVLKKEIMSSLMTKIGGLLLSHIFADFKKRFDYTEYGGAAFLGVNNICIKAHGSSDAKAFKNAIRQAQVFYDNNVINKIKSELENTKVDTITEQKE